MLGVVLYRFACVAWLFHMCILQTVTPLSARCVFTPPPPPYPASAPANLLRPHDAAYYVRTCSLCLAFSFCEACVVCKEISLGKPRAHYASHQRKTQVKRTTTRIRYASNEYPCFSSTEYRSKKIFESIPAHNRASLSLSLSFWPSLDPTPLDRSFFFNFVFSFYLDVTGQPATPHI